MQQLKDAGIEGMESYVSTVANETMTNAGNTANDSDRAWALRRGIDNLRSRLTSQMGTGIMVQ